MIRDNRFVGNGMEGIRFGDSICNDCEHYNDIDTTCNAFPDGMPNVVLYGEIKHTEPYPEDRGSSLN